MVLLIKASPRTCFLSALLICESICSSLKLITVAVLSVIAISCIFVLQMSCPVFSKCGQMDGTEIPSPLFKTLYL